MQSLRGYQEAGSTPCILHALEGFARLALGEAHPEQAVRLLSAAETWQQTHRTSLRPIEQMLFDQTMATARSMLTEAAFAAAWGQGRAMSLERAIAHALEEEGEPT